MNFAIQSVLHTPHWPTCCGFPHKLDFGWVIGQNQQLNRSNQQLAGTSWATKLAKLFGSWQRKQDAPAGSCWYVWVGVLIVAGRSGGWNKTTQKHTATTRHRTSGNTTQPWTRYCWELPIHAVTFLVGWKAIVSCCISNAHLENWEWGVAKGAIEERPP